MGCDIRMQAQIDWNADREYRRPGPWWVDLASDLRIDRNYKLFAALAGVRNGYGFAGIYTHEPLRPISDPRGYPEDMAEKIEDDKEYGDGFWFGDHSHSWLLLSEVLAYDWDQPITAAGVVTLDQFNARLKEHGNAVPLTVPTAPYEEWCGDITGPGIVTIEATEPVQRVDASARVHVRDYWTTPLRAYCKDFLDRWVPALETLSGGRPETVRLVFGFDS